MPCNAKDGYRERHLYRRNVVQHFYGWMPHRHQMGTQCHHNVLRLQPCRCKDMTQNAAYSSVSGRCNGDIFLGYQLHTQKAQKPHCCLYQMCAHFLSIAIFRASELLVTSCFQLEPCFTGELQGKQTAKLKYCNYLAELPSSNLALPIIWKICTTFLHGIEDFVPNFPSAKFCFTKISRHQSW